MTLQDLIDSFTLEGISGGNAVFDTAKLDWMNGQYIARLPTADLAAAVVPLLQGAGLWPPADDRRDTAWLHRLLELLRPRAKRLVDFVDQALPFLVDTVEYEPEAVRKHLGVEALDGHVDALIASLRERLASYKIPRRLVVVASVPRAANGKADYPGARRLFESASH